MIRITIDDINASPSHKRDMKAIKIAPFAPAPEFLKTMILDWNRILFVENNIFKSNTAKVGFSLTAASFLPIIKTTY
jgi:hypothetical protein